MATTTTTTMGQPKTRVEASNRRMYWGVAIAALIVLAILFATRASRNDVVTTTGVSDSTLIAPTTSSQSIESNTTVAPAATAATTARSATTTTSESTVNANAATAQAKDGYNIDNGTMDLQNQPNNRLTNKNAANPNAKTTK